MENGHPRIYVASLSDYNAGRLVGKWIDLEFMTADDIYEEIGAFLESLGLDEYGCEREEWAVHDHEFLPIDVGEYPDLDTLDLLASAIRLSEEYPAEAIRDYLDNMGEPASLDGFADAYQGEFESEKAYAEEYAEEMGYFRRMEDAGISSRYFDVEQLAVDLFCGEVWMSDNGHVFVLY